MEGKPVNEQHISHYLFEAISARMERTIRRLWIALIIAIVAIFILWITPGKHLFPYLIRHPFVMTKEVQHPLSI